VGHTALLLPFRLLIHKRLPCQDFLLSIFNNSTFFSVYLIRLSSGENILENVEKWYDLNTTMRKNWKKVENMPTNRGKRRHGAPSGYMTSTEAIAKLGKMLYRHVKEGRIRKIVPDGFKQGFYHIGDIEAILATEEYFTTYKRGDYRKHPSSTFELAREEDLPTIFEISAKIFSEPPLLETRLVWLRKNPETFHVLRDQAGIVRGFSSLLPMRTDVLTKFIQDKIESEEIGADDVELYVPGKPIHLYIMAVAVDPICSTAEKHTYGSRLVSGIFSFLLDLAQRGVNIETITARTYKPDGLRLLRKLGFPQLRSPVPGKNLFSIRIADSGMPLFLRYSELLNQWKQDHATATVYSTRQRTTHPLRSTPAPSNTPTDLPEGSIALAELAQQLGINRTTLLGHVKNEANNLAHIAIPRPGRANEFTRYFTPEQALVVREWHTTNSRK